MILYLQSKIKYKRKVIINILINLHIIYYNNINYFLLMKAKRKK